MKAWRVVRPGTPGRALELLDVEAPQPGPGQVRVRTPTSPGPGWGASTCSTSSARHGGPCRTTRHPITAFHRRKP